MSLPEISGWIFTAVVLAIIAIVYYKDLKSDNQKPNNMKTVYIITSCFVFESGEFVTRKVAEPFNSYQEAEQYILELPAGQYQIQKIFIKES
jgi:hypothetical protein